MLTKPAASGPGSGWTISDPGPATNTCPSPGIASSAPYATTSHLGGWTMTFTPPASTQVAGYRLWRTVHIDAPWNYTLFDNPQYQRERAHHRRSAQGWAVAVLDPGLQV